MNLSKLSDMDLIDLIKKASAELSDRMNAPTIERVPSPCNVVVVREPNDDQKDVVLAIKARLQRGEYITASDRRDVAAITSEFPEWARLQRMPTEHGTWAWRKAKEFHSLARAKER